MLGFARHGRLLLPDGASGGDSGEGFRDDLEPDRARALDEDYVAGLNALWSAYRGIRRIGDRLAAVAARELADAEHDVDAEAADELADLAVVLRRGRAELRHLSEHRDLAATVLREILERRAHRGRVRVVRVVD